VSGQLHVPAALLSGKHPPVPVGYEVGCTPELAWTTWRRENSCPYRDSNSDPSVVQPVASRYTEYAIPGRFAKGKKVKLSQWQAVEAHRVVRGRGFHIFWTFGSQMAEKLSALRAGRPLLPGRFLVLISVRGWIDPTDIVHLEGLKIQWHRESNPWPSGL
jgi:hypothetical protein